MTLRNTLRSVLRRCGWDVTRYPPARTTDAWASLQSLDIRTIIDIGAFDGDSGRRFRRLWPTADLHCFEPNPASHRRLRDWAALQQQPVYIYDVALGNAPGTALLRGIETKPQQTSLVENFAHAAAEHRPYEIAVRVERMDDMLDATALAPGILVKIDVEGYERAVLLGGRAILDRAAICIIEVHTRFEKRGSAGMAEIATMLRGHGLTFAGMTSQFFIPRTHRYLFGDALFANWALCPQRA